MFFLWVFVVLTSFVRSGCPLTSLKRSVFQGDRIVAGVMHSNYDKINYLHGEPWGHCDTRWFEKPCSFMVCPHHVEAIVSDAGLLFPTANELNLRRTNNDAEKSFITAGRQLSFCSAPECVGSVNDLLVCGGMALAVTEWAQMTEIVRVTDRDKGHRGPVCGTGKFAMWTDSSKPYHILPEGNFPRMTMILGMIDFARCPVLCSELYARSEKLDKDAIKTIHNRRTEELRTFFQNQGSDLRSVLF